MRCRLRRIATIDVNTIAVYCNTGELFWKMISWETNIIILHNVTVILTGWVSGRPFRQFTIESVHTTLLYTLKPILMKGRTVVYTLRGNNNRRRRSTVATRYIVRCWLRLASASQCTKGVCVYFFFLILT